MIKKIITLSLVVIIFIYIALLVFPNKSFFNYLDLKVGPYDPQNHKLIEIEKKHILLPGPKSIWAARTSTGLNFYRSFEDASSLNRKIIFSIDIERTEKQNSPYRNVPPSSISIIDAVKGADKVLVKTLLDSGEDIDQLDNFGNTLLFYTDNREMIEFLIEQGLNLHKTNKKGQTPIFNANSKALITTLLNKGVDPENLDKQGNTPIITITSREATLALIDHGVDVFVKRNDGVPLISLPFKLKYPDIVNILLEKGIDPNIRDKQKRTPLHLVVGLFSPEDNFDQKKIETIDILLEHGADINALDYEGRTPLDLAPPVEIYQTVREHLKFRGGENHNPRY